MWVRFILTAICLLFCTGPIVDGGYGNSEGKVKLRDIETLTLNHGHYTNGRRSPGVPQIKCVGGSAGCKVFTPSTVQCYNRGSNGHNTQWECKAEMPSKYKFGAIEVTCEGYDYPDDPYVLHGSCGLEYNLEHASAPYSTYSNDESKSSFGSMLVILGIIGIAVALYYTCIAVNTHGAANMHTGSQPPPAGFRSDFLPNQNFGGSGYSNDGNCGSGPFGQGGMGGFGGGNTGSRNTGASGGGFWTGAATGGLLGYMMGRNNGNTNTHQRHGFQTTDYSTGSSSTFSSPSSKTETSTSSGFGGTKRR